MTMASAGAIWGKYMPDCGVVASRVALDLAYWAMCSAPYRLIRMAIEIASKEVGAFFSVVNYMSCINVAKQSWYGPLKIKLSYTIV